MSALEQKIMQEIVEKFQLLQPAAKKQVLEALTSVEHREEEPFDYKAWHARIEAVREEMRARLGDNAVTGVQDLLNELREEASY